MSAYLANKARIKALVPAICAAYSGGLSLGQVTAEFRIDKETLLRIMKQNGVKSRSVAEGNALRWTEPEFRANQVKKKLGNRNNAKGGWKVAYQVSKPNLKGHKNHLWRGGKTKLRILISGTFTYRSWRTAVFERDNYTCKLCEARSGKGKGDVSLHIPSH